MAGAATEASTVAAKEAQRALEEQEEWRKQQMEMQEAHERREKEAEEREQREKEARNRWTKYEGGSASGAADSGPTVDRMILLFEHLAENQAASNRTMSEMHQQGVFNQQDLLRSLIRDRAERDDGRDERVDAVRARADGRRRDELRAGVRRLSLIHI